MLLICDVQRVVIERRHSTYNPAKHCHWMSVISEATNELLNLAIYHGVILNSMFKTLLLLSGGERSLKKQVTGFNVV